MNTTEKSVDLDAKLFIEDGDGPSYKRIHATVHGESRPVSPESLVAMIDMYTPPVEGTLPKGLRHGAARYFGENLEVHATPYGEFWNIQSLKKGDLEFVNKGSQLPKPLVGLDPILSAYSKD